MSKNEWKVQIKGERCSGSWEISVVHIDNIHGQRSWGWINNKKLLVSHNGSPCDWPICGFVWDQQVLLAEKLCAKLNSGEDIERAKLEETYDSFPEVWNI